MSYDLSSLEILKMRRSKNCLTIGGMPPPTAPRCRPQRWPLPAPAIGSSTSGHHRLTFEVGRLALGAGAHRHLDFFEACRRKRNVIDYDHASVATHTEAEEIVAEAKDFLALVERWIAANHPGFTP